MNYKSILFVGLMLPALLCCKKEATKSIPTITIGLITNITSNSAECGGEITSDGGSAVTDRGICWSSNENPTTTDNKSASGEGIGTFSCSLTELIPGAIYYIKAYAVNSAGTAYSEQTTLTTLSSAGTKPLLFGLSWGGVVPSNNIVAKYNILGLDAWKFSDAQRLKALFPGLKVVTYKCIASTRSGTAHGSDGWMPTGVDYYTAPEEWFAHNGSGARLEWVQYPNSWQMLVGVPAYQQKWLSNVSSELPQNGWDGAFMDNANRFATIYGNQVYATDNESETATHSFLQNVALPIRNSGMIAIANVEAGRLKPGLWSDWAQFTSGLFEEHWMGWNGYLLRESHTTSEGIGGAMREVEEAVARGAKVFARIHTEFGRAGVAYRFGALRLCVDVEKDAYTEADGKDPGIYPELALSLGPPTGDRYVIQDGVYGRDFQNGRVWVNADPTISFSHDLGGTYIDADGNQVTRVTLAPLTAIHLRKN